MFGLDFARLTGAQVAQIAGVGAGVTVLWFLLRPRARALVVSSHVLWAQILPRRRDPLLKDLLLLFLQLLAVATLALALGEPRPKAEEAVAREGAWQRVWVVDRSLSMGADDGARARIERVARDLEEALDDLPEGVEVGLIGASETPELLSPCGMDRARTHLALRLLDVDGVRADLGAALHLAAAQPGLLRDQTVIELWTDDPAAPDLARAFSQEQGWDLRLRAPFTPAPNLAITAFDLRASEGIPAEEEAVVRVRNLSPFPATATLSLETDEAVLGEATLRLDPNEEATRRYRFRPLEAGGAEAILQDARFEGPDGPRGDGLAADDRAFAWLQPVRPLTVLLVSDGNRYLERVLALLPGIRLDRMAPSAWGRRARARAEASDVVFLDAFLPPGRPLPRAFYVAPPPGGPFEVGAALRDPQVTDWSPDHPLLRGLILEDLAVREGELFRPREGDVRLVGTPSGPLAVARDEGIGRRSVGWGFDFGQSDLPLRVAFPQIIVNTLLWMREGRAAGPPPGGRHPLTAPLWMGPEGPADAQPAEPRPGVLLTDLRRARAARAAGDERRAERATRPLDLAPGLQPIRFPAPGLYRLEGDGWRRDLAINLPATGESDLRSLPSPRDPPVPAPVPPDVPPAPPTAWLVLAALAGVLLVGEFALWTR